MIISRTWSPGLVCALYWFNPLVWLAARRMVAERERACDDIVLRHGAKPADYAEQVLEISAGLSTGWLAGSGGIAMAAPLEPGKSPARDS